MLSGEVTRRHPPDRGPVHLFDDVAPILRSGDIIFGNLETPLCVPAVERTMFRAHPAFAQTLAGGAGLPRWVLRDHAAAIIKYIVENMEQPQLTSEEIAKAQGEGPSGPT